MLVRQRRDWCLAWQSARHFLHLSRSTSRDLTLRTAGKWRVMGKYRDNLDCPTEQAFGGLIEAGASLRVTGDGILKSEIVGHSCFPLLYQTILQNKRYSLQCSIQSLSS